MNHDHDVLHVLQWLVAECGAEIRLRLCLTFHSEIHVKHINRMDVMDVIRWMDVIVGCMDDGWMHGWMLL